MEKEWFEVEDEKYSWLYSQGYPKGDPEKLVGFFSIPNESKVIDLGCGLGSLSRIFPNYTGVDVSEFVVEKCKKDNRGIYHHLSLHTLDPLYEEKYDCAINADVMEHIPPEEVDSVLESISKINAKRFVFAISTRPSGILDKDGGNLHLTIWDKDKWLFKISEYFAIQNHKVGKDVVYISATN